MELTLKLNVQGFLLWVQIQILMWFLYVDFPVLLALWELPVVNFCGENAEWVPLSHARLQQWCSPASNSAPFLI